MKIEFIKHNDPDKLKNIQELTHWQNNIEIIFTEQANLDCLLNGKTICISSGDICIININELHKVSMDIDSEYSFFRIYIDPSDYTHDSNIYQKYILPLISENSFDTIIAKKGETLNTELTRILKHIARVYSQKTMAWELAYTGLTYIILQLLYIHCFGKKSDKDAYKNADIAIFRNMASFIYTSFTKRLSLDEIATSGNVSISKCCKLFKEFAQTSPINFLNDYRLNYSLDLLKKTDNSIANIAQTCGFEQQSYYNRLFLRKYAITPSQYRNSSPN